jgi:hypothetical protein
MAQTNYTPISLYYSTTASAVPSAGNLVNGELAININTADGKLYYKDSAGVVQLLASKGGGVGSSTNNQVLYNNGGSVAGVSPGTNGNVLTSNGTTWSSAAASSGVSQAKATMISLIFST